MDAAQLSHVDLALLVNAIKPVAIAWDVLLPHACLFKGNVAIGLMVATQSPSNVVLVVQVKLVMQHQAPVAFKQPVLDLELSVEFTQMVVVE